MKLTTYAAAQALAPRGIRVNGIHPGLVATELVTGDFGLPADAITSAFPVPIGPRPPTHRGRPAAVWHAR